MRAPGSEATDTASPANEPDRAGRATLVALSLIVLLGASLRLLGISFGLPYHHHWDEGWIVDSVVGMLRRHDGVPASYQYGEPLMRLTELGFVLIRWVERRCCTVSPVDAQTSVYLVARVVTALISSSGIVAVYMAARCTRPAARASAWGPLAAALLYAVAWELVLHSRFAVTDASLVALTAWTLAFAGRYLTSRRITWGIACAVAAGVTFAFKVPALMTASIPIMAALVLYLRASRLGEPRREHGVLLLAAIPMVLAIYVLLNPHLVDRSSDAFRDLVGRYHQTRDGGVSAVYLRRPGIPHLLSALGAILTLFPSRSVGASLVINAVAIYGMVQGVRRRDPMVIVSVAYAVALVLSVALPNRAFLLRNYIVTIPVVSLGFGIGIVDLARTLRARLKPYGLAPAAVVPLLAIGMAAVVGLSLFDAIEAQRLREDPRVSAIGWLAEQSRDGKPVDVAMTSGIFGKQVPGSYPELRDILSRPTVSFAAAEVEKCPDPINGPRYVLDASYRDIHKAPASDPWQELWLFRDCAGYEQAAAFGPNPYEADLRAYPTWIGRVSAIVLRRIH